MSMPLPFCVYVLFSEKDNQLYTGFTGNIINRINSHNNGLNPSTANRRPLKLIFADFYLYEEDARKRERYLKTSMGKKAIRYMLGNTINRLKNNQDGDLWSFS